MTQFLVLAGPRNTEPSSRLGLRFQPVTQEAVADFARVALAVASDEPVFEPVSAEGEEFGFYFDRRFDVRDLDTLIDDCAKAFSGIAFFYGLQDELPMAPDLSSLKAILRSKCTTPIELYAVWTEGHL